MYNYDETCINYERNTEFSDCEYYEPIPSIKMSNILGRKVCGNRSSSNFKEAVRPLYEDSRCPDGFEACYPLV